MSIDPRTRFLFRGPARTWPEVRPEISGRVAVVTRTQDRPLLLGRACESVLAQTYGNWLMVVVNDGGDAQCVEQVLTPYRPAFDARLHVIHHPSPLGMEAAANAGLRACDSEFAVILDDDDSWHPDFLRESAAVLSDPASSWMGGVTCHVRRVLERIENGEILFEKDVDYNSWMEAVSLDRMLAENHIVPCAFLYRRAVHDEIGWFNETLPVLGDWEFLIRFLLTAEIGVIGRPLAYYHQRANLDGTAYSNSVHGDVMRRYNALTRNDALRHTLTRNRELVGLSLSTNHNLLQISKKIEDFQRHDYGIEEFKKDTFFHLEEFKAVIFRHVESLKHDFARHAELVPGKVAELIPGKVEEVLQKELCALNSRLDQILREKMTKVDEIHLWLGILTWPLRAVWRPLRRFFLSLAHPGR
jgi:glycosyltransferase involved in cell wall biosynthesis